MKISMNTQTSSHTFQRSGILLLSACAIVGLSGCFGGNTDEQQSQNSNDAQFERKELNYFSDVGVALALNV